MSEAARRALVTGGSSGIGRCIAETLARDGCDVGIFYQGRPEDAQPVRERVESHGRRFWSAVGDVRDSASVNQAVETFLAQLGGIDMLVNNAGVFRDQVVWKLSDEQWREVIDVNLTGMFHCVRAVVPALRANGWGTIVNISSINGLRGKFGQANYSAAKAGVVGLTKTLARELARFNVTVNAVAPGLIETPAIAAMTPETRRQSLDEILLGRAGKCEDVAELVAFLCGERARFITGDVIRVDGGQYV
jgi:NAD(P)-dependent dehydrogenase (short-subunit alcohol dehydrogenase family)